MSRVAKGKEKQWLEFAKGKSMATIKDEVHRCIEENRRTPRKDGYGLRNRKINMIFKLTLEEQDKVLKAFLKLARELSPCLKGRKLEPKEIFLYLIQRLLETDPAGTPIGRVEKEDPLSTILYHVCRTCNSAHLMTPDGPVEVPMEVVDRVRGSAEEVEISAEEEWEIIVDAASPVIDKPNPASLARKVCLRDGGCCANCKRKLGLQPITFDSGRKVGARCWPMNCAYVRAVTRSCMRACRSSPETRSMGSPSTPGRTS